MAFVGVLGGAPAWALVAAPRGDVLAAGLRRDAPGTRCLPITFQVFFALLVRLYYPSQPYDTTLLGTTPTSFPTCTKAPLALALALV